MLLYSLLLPFAAALCVPWLYRFLGRKTGWAVALVPAGLFIAFATHIGRVGSEALRTAWAWIPSMGVELTLSLSGLSLLFALLITGIGALIVIYSTFYMGPREDLGKFYLYILLFLGAMLGVVLADNLVVLYIFWELTSVSSFLLIGFWHSRDESRAGALKSLLITVLGGFAILAGVVLLFVAGGSFEFADLLAEKDAIRGSGFYLPIVLLLLTGAFTKSAQVPFHIWLPGAMAAPTPVSAYLHSATMVKAGIFLVAKLSPLLGGTELWYYLIGGVGAATMLLGAILAVRQTDLKALLACSTVSQLGLIMPMFAVGTDQGTLAGAAHILNHATFKGALFMLVGIIDHETRTRDLRQLGGLRTKMPLTAALMGIAALSMAGVWPLNGFISKEMIFEAMVHPHFGPNTWTWVFALATVVGSIFTTVYSLILAHRIHFGAPTRHVEESGAHDPPAGMLLAPALLVAFVVLFGLFPKALGAPVFEAAAAAVVGHAPVGHIPALPAWGLPLGMSIAALALGLLGYANLDGFRRVSESLRWPSSNAVYERALAGLDRLAVSVTRAHMTGLLRDYLVFICATLIIAAGYSAWRGAVWGPVRLDLAPLTLWEGAALLAICISALVVAFSNRRLAAIVALGMVGATVSYLYVLLQAPDLALTQLMIEAVSTVLMLLAFAKLPALRKEVAKVREKRLNAIVAVATGALVAGLALIANGTSFFPSIAGYYVDHSLDLGGGRNIVNVILVDFRGIDTMGEITVLSIAGLSVYSLIRLRKRGESQKDRRSGEAS